MLVVHPPAALFPFVVWILSKRDCVCTWRTVASYSCCVIHTGNTREDTEGNFLSFSYCEAESQISKLLGAFFLSISKPVKSTGEPNTRMPAEHGLKNGTQLISVISLCCPISDRKVGQNCIFETSKSHVLSARRHASLSTTTMHTKWLDQKLREDGRICLDILIAHTLDTEPHPYNLPYLFICNWLLMEHDYTQSLNLGSLWFKIASKSSFFL